jgi:hypothetical protein
VNNVPTLHIEAMGNKVNNDEEDDRANIIVNNEAALSKDAMEKKIISKKHL